MATVKGGRQPTGDKAEYAKIAKMSVEELLDYVISNPHYLTDSYYRGYNIAIYERHEELRND